MGVTTNGNDGNSSMVVKMSIVFTLIQTMTKSHPGNDNLPLSILLNCVENDSGKNLDDFLLNCGASFTKNFDLPAMTKDNKTIYHKNKGYLALIHPTLG